MYRIFELFVRITRKFHKLAIKLYEANIPHSPISGRLFPYFESSLIGTTRMVIKQDTVERVKPFDLFDIIEDINFLVKYPKIELIEYQSAHIFANADYLIIDDKGVIWNKRNYPMFSKMQALDEGITEYNEKNIRINQNTEVLNIDFAFSMCGVYAKVWSHFMIQYLPKLYFFTKYAKKNQDRITIVLPEYSDAQVKEVVSMYTSELSNIEIIVLKDNQSVLCNKLLYIESTSMISDHETYQTYIDFFIPQCVVYFLRNEFVAKCIEYYGVTKKQQKEKLYIVRKNAQWRNIINIEEIESYFRQKGFLFIEPHLLTIKEKIELFYNASEIAGPISAGFSNLIFCQQNTKVCLLSNIQRGFETYLSYFVDQSTMKISAVLGKDTENHSQSSFIIPLEKIDKAFRTIFEQSEV